MLSIYISSEFVEEFQTRSDYSDEVIHDFYYFFIKKIRGAEIFVDIDENLLYQKKDEIEFYDFLCENPIKCDSSWVSKINSKDFIEQSDFSQLFLLGDNINCNDLIKEHRVLFINNKNLKSEWKKVSINRDCSEMTPNNLNENEHDFTDWSQLQKFQHPFNKLIINDGYILSDKADQRINDNLKPLLKAFYSFINNETIPTTILSKEILSKKRNESFENFNEAIEILRDPIIDESKIKLILYNDSKSALNRSQIKDEHDREIYTNYLVFECPAGWNIFKSNHEVNHRTKITIKSIFKNDVRNSWEKAFHNFKEYFNKIQTPTTIVIPGQLSPDKKSAATREINYHYPADLSPGFIQC